MALFKILAMLYLLVFCLFLIIHCDAVTLLSTNNGAACNFGDIKNFTCDSGTSNMPNTTRTYFQWNQYYYQNSAVITNLPAIQSYFLKFSLTFEYFDNDTVIYGIFQAYPEFDNTLLAKTTVHCYGQEYKRFIFPANTNNVFRNVVIIRYRDNDTMQFSCKEYVTPNSYVYIGMVPLNPISMISVYDKHEVTVATNKYTNGSLICCLRYVTHNVGNGKHIVRFVEKKTLLIRDTSANFCPIENVQGTKKNTNSKTDSVIITTTAAPTTASTLPTTYISTLATTESSLSSLSITTSLPTPSTTTESSTSTTTTQISTSSTPITSTAFTITDESGGYITVIIWIVIAMTIIILAIVILIIVRKRRRPKIRPPQSLPTGSNGETTPFYLNLLFRRECEQEIRTQEHLYEEIN